MTGLRGRILDALTQWSDRSDGYEAGTDAVLGVLGDPDTLALIQRVMTEHRRRPRDGSRCMCGVETLGIDAIAAHQAAAVVAALTDKETQLDRAWGLREAERDLRRALSGDTPTEPTGDESRCEHSGMPVRRCKAVDICDCFDHPEADPVEPAKSKRLSAWDLLGINPHAVDYRASVPLDDLRGIVEDAVANIDPMDADGDWNRLIDMLDTLLARYARSEPTQDGDDR